MTAMNQFVRDDVLPSWWANSVQEHIATIVSNLRLSLLNSTTVRVAAGVDDDQVTIGIDGKWRRKSVTLDKAHPGGGAGQFGIFATAKANDIVSSPLPGTDNTDYAFDLAFIAGAGVPAIVPGTVDHFRKVGTCEWSGTAITRLDQLVAGRVSGDPIYAAAPLTTITPLVVRGAVGASAPLLSAGTVTDVDKLSLSSAGLLSLPVQGSAGGLLIGGDTTLYRAGATTLRTGGFLEADWDVLANAGTANQTRIGNAGPSNQAGVRFGSASDTILYRQAAGTLRTGGFFQADQAIYANATGAAQLTLGDQGPAGQSGIKFGLAGDTNLYRYAADHLATDDTLYVSILSDQQIRLGVGTAHPTMGSIEFGGGDTNLYRSAANSLKTDDNFSVAGALVALAYIQADDSIYTTRSAGSAIFLDARVTGDTVQRYTLTADGKHSWGAGGASALDTNLYRSAANELKTDDTFKIGSVITLGSNGFADLAGDVRARYGTAEEITIGAVGPSSQSGVVFGGAARDTNLYRGAANILRTDDALEVNGLYLTAGGAIYANTPNAGLTADSVTLGYFYKPGVGVVNPGPGIAFGTVNAGADTSFYKGTAAGRLIASGGLGVGSMDPADGLLQFPQATTAAGGIYFGVDTNLYRSAPNTLKADGAGGLFAQRLAVFPAAWRGDAIIAGLAGDAVANRFAIDTDGFHQWSTGAAAPDVNLYRASANILKTDYSFIAVGNTWVKAGTAEEIRIGAYGPGGQAGVTFGSATDTNLYRSAADTLKTDDALIASGEVSFDSDKIKSVLGRLYADPGGLSLSTTVDAGVALSPRVSGATGLFIKGLAGQTGNLIYAMANDTSTLMLLGPTGQLNLATLGSTGGLVIGDTNLYRSAADTLKTDDAFHVALAFRHLGTTLGFYNAAAVAQNTGWGAALATNFTNAVSRKTLTGSYTMDELRDVVATHIDAVRATGLLGA